MTWLEVLTAVGSTLAILTAAVATVRAAWRIVRAVERLVEHVGEIDRVLEDHEERLQMSGRWRHF